MKVSKSSAGASPLQRARLSQEAVEMRGQIVRDLLVQFELQCRGGRVDLYDPAERPGRPCRYPDPDNCLCFTHGKCLYVPEFILFAEPAAVLPTGHRLMPTVLLVF